MAVLNPNISHTMIEGGMFKAEVDAKKIMAVPTVFLNGEEFASGRQTIEQLLEQAAGPTSKDSFADKDLFDVLVVGAVQRVQVLLSTLPVKGSIQAWWWKLSVVK